MISPTRQVKDKECMNLYVEKSFKENFYKFCENKDLIPSRFIQKIITERYLNI